MTGASRLFASIGRLHIVAIAALGTLTFGWIFTGERPFGLAAICALDWFVVNLLNRVVDLEEDQANAIRGTGFVERHRRALLGLGLGLLLGSFALTHLVYPQITPLRAAGHLLGLAYNWPLWPGGRRLKALYFFKNTASATGFMVTVFGYPLALAGWGTDPSRLAPSIDGAAIATTAAFFFLFELSYEVIYDLRDREGDAKAGIRSYPVVHGQAGAVRIIDGLIGGAVAILLGGFALGLLPWRVFVMILGPALQLAYYKRALGRGITSGDCIAITWLGAALLVAYHLYALAGLPGSDL